MNKILPHQPSWLASVTHTRSGQGQNFTEALHGGSDEDAKQAKPGSAHVAGTTDSARFLSAGSGSEAVSTEESESGEPGQFTETGYVPGAWTSWNDDGMSVSVPDHVVLSVNTKALSIGLLPPGQVAWSRIYPEHLIASGYLSVVDTAEHGGNMASGRVDVDGLEAHSDIDTATPMMDGETGAAQGAVTPSSNLSSLQYASIEGHSASAADTEIASSPRAIAAIALANHIWAERLMRLTRHADGGTTVWLRDYGLKESDLTPLVSSLIQLGRESGFQIGRVVINGREIWRAIRSEGED